MLLVEHTRIYSSAYILLWSPHAHIARHDFVHPGLDGFRMCVSQPKYSPHTAAATPPTRKTHNECAALTRTTRNKMQIQLYIRHAKLGVLYVQYEPTTKGGLWVDCAKCAFVGFYVALRQTHIHT